MIKKSSKKKYIVIFIIIMPAKLSLIALIHSINEKDSTNYIVREAMAVVRYENNTTMDLKVTSFIPKDISVPRWVPLFVPGNVLRLTGKFALNDESLMVF